jgi:hypothetical protein
MSNTREPDETRAGAPSRLDLAIDRAVQRMVVADPPAGLRRRVLERLAAPAPRRALIPQFAFAFGALAILMLAVMVIQRGESPVILAPEQQVANAPSPQAAPPPVEPSRTPVQEAPVNPETTAQVRPRRGPVAPAPPQMAEIFGPRPGRISAATLPGRVDDPSTPAVEPGTIFLSPIAHLPPMRLTDFTFAPLDIPPLRIDPLSPPR